ncbi:MAG: 30S ribosomal protein S20 [Sandaracinaceae bacterium]|nr:30S ribosomal protein S20 [Sandaracinaceae bacterium]
MPNVPSAEKRVRQTKRRTARNKHIRSTARGAIKKVRAAIAAGDLALARQALVVAMRRIDKAVSKGVFHRKTGSRYISRLSAQVHALAKRLEASSTNQAAQATS